MRNNQRRFGSGEQAPALVSTGPTPAYVVPTEFVELPSRGKFYPAEHALHGQETVEIKYMTAKEEDILSSSALINKGLVVDRLLQSIMVLNVDPKTLLIGDRNAIMISARISAYGAGYNAEVTCPKCLNRAEYVFDLEKTNLTENCFDPNFLAEEQVSFDQESNLFNINLPISNVTVSVRLFDGSDEKGIKDEYDDAAVITSMLANFIVAVADNNDPAYVQGFIENMPAGDSKYLRGLYPKLAPNIDLKQVYTCTNCAHEQDMEVPLSAEFFWPK